MLPIVFLMSPAIYSTWKKTNYSKLTKKLLTFLFYSIVITYIFMNFYFKSDIFIVYLAMSLAFFTIISSVAKLLLILKNSNNKKIISNIFSIPSSMLSNLLAHIGIGILIIGITLSNYYSIQKEVAMQQNSQVLVKDITIKFVDVKNKISKNYTSQVGVFDAYINNDYFISFFPEKRTYNIQKNIMTEAAINSTLLRDIYVALGENLSNDTWVVRIYYKPYIQLLWYGVLLMILGGLFGIFGRNKLEKKLNNDS